MKSEAEYNFNTLYTQYYRKSFLFVKSYVHDEMVSEDIVSDTLIKLWDLLQEEPLKSYDALLVTMLKNKSLDYLKHAVIRQETHQLIAEGYERELNLRISTLEACDPSEIFSIEIIEIVEHTLVSLPPQTRCVFELSRNENLTNKEIAVKLSISIKAVEYHITKVLKVLRISLKDYTYVSLFC